MLAIAIRFPAGGRYHATAWGSHVNEGVPEWPPSPWRIVRSLIATARWKDGRSTCEDPPRLRELVETLAAAPPPRYFLPKTAAAHTRHYMPLGDDKTTKIFDTFVQFQAGDDLVVLWDIELDAGQRDYLASLLPKLGYVGRAESLAEAELLPPEWPPTGRPDAYPMAPGQPLDEGGRTFKLLAPQAPAEYASWRSGHAPAAGTKLKPRERKALPPVDLFAALNTDTQDWRGAGWSQPPGSRWLEYVRPATPFVLAAQRTGRSRPDRSGERPNVARYEIQSRVRESLTKALSLGERFHVALCSFSNASPVFSGKLDGATVEGHGHAYYIPECDGRGMLTRVTVFARMGFDPEAIDALRSLRGTWSRNSPGLKLLLLGFGDASEFPDVPALSRSSDWVSLTPFVPVRHIQRSRTGKPRVDAETGLVRGGPEHDLRRLIVQAGFPAPASIEMRDSPPLEGRKIRWADFQRDRRTGEGTGIVTRSGHGLRVRFPEPVNGPLAFGYGAHFGLGVFVPYGSLHDRRSSCLGESPMRHD